MTESPRAWLATLAAAAANIVTFGTLFSFGVFLTPLATSFDTTTGGISPLFSITVAVYYLAGAVAGRVGDRFGVRRVVTVAAVALPLGLWLASIARSLPLLYLAYAPLVGVAVGCCYTPLIGAVGRWFDRRRPLAIAVVLVGVGGGTLILPNVCEFLIDRYGWRSSFRVLALIGAVVLVAVVLILRDEGTATERSRPTLRPFEARHSTRFRRLYLSIILIGPGFYAPVAFFNDFAIARGVGPEAAAALLGLIGGSSVIARLVIASTLTQHLGPIRQYRLGYLLLTASLVVWFVADGSYPLLVFSAVLHGVGWAAWVAAAPLVLSDWFGAANLGGLLGLLYTGLGIGGLAGPAVGGWIIDRWGYETSIAVVIVTNLGALALAPRRPSPAPGAQS